MTIHSTPGNGPHNQAHSCLQAYLNNAYDGVFTIGEDLKFRFANITLAGWMNETGMENGCSILPGLIGLSESMDLFVHKCEIALAGTPVRFECLIRPRHSLPRWVEISLSRASLPRPEIVITGVARDISAHKHEITKLKRQAGFDELTGLLNRRELTRRLQALAAHPQENHHALLYLDLDQFKAVNDACGHLAGDELLRQVAKIIQDTMQDNGTLARVGGDEFAILLENCTPEAAEAAAVAIREAASNFRFYWGGKRFDIGVSIGIAIITPKNEGTDCALSAADSACHVAKEKGRNHIHVHSGSMECAYRKQEAGWISRITEAFEENRFRLYYQNILPIGPDYGCFDHREILVRMIDEHGRQIEPGEFLPAAEKYHLMPLIDRWVIRTLFSRNNELWNSAYQLLQPGGKAAMPLCCINLSGATLNDEYFPDFLKDQIELHQIPPQAICFEITETVAIGNLEKVCELIQDLKALGFRFALDDFGSGMSSFAYLKSLPVDFLKIDGSLVRDIDESRTDLCMVEAINRIAQEMGIQTIAEFVKNNDVIKKLRSIGVNYAQGYGIHQPESLY